MDNKYEETLQLIEQTKKIDMGTKWSLEELQIFLEQFRESGLEKIDQIVQDLSKNNFHRSPYNILSLYVKNKKLLQINSKVTITELCSILQDYFNDDIPQQTPNIPQNQNNNVQDQTLEADQFQKNKKTKNHKGSLDSNIVTETTPQQNQEEQQHKRQKLRFKGYFPKLENNENIIEQVQKEFKNIKAGNQKKNNDQSKDMTLQPSNLYMQWIIQEFFYSDIENPYFKFNEFQHLMIRAGLTNITTLKKKEWYLLRKAMGKPRRFSSKFIADERNKLNGYRQIVENYLIDPHYYKIEEQIKNKDIVNQIKSLGQFNVGQIVKAVHPICHQIHQGKILTTRENNIIVKFITNELGVHKVLGSQIKIDTQEEQLAIQNQKQLQEEENQENKQNDKMEEEIEQDEQNQSQNQHQQQQQFNGQDIEENQEQSFNQSLGQDNNQNLSEQTIVQDLDIQSMSFLIKILDRKTVLINYLKEMNDIVEKQKQENNNEPINQQYYQEYGWLGIQINLLDDALKHIVAKFRLRGLKNYNDMGLISGNMDKILQNSLTKIKEFVDNQGDEQQMNQLRDIEAKNQEDKIEQDIQEMAEAQENIIQQENEIQEKNTNKNEQEEDEGDETNSQKMSEDKQFILNRLKAEQQQYQRGSAELEQNNGIDIEQGDEQQQQQQQQLDKQNDVKHLAMSCVGVLKTLQQQQIQQQQQQQNNNNNNNNNTQPIGIEQSRFLQDVSQSIYNPHQDKFFQLQNTISNIITKNK